jgi:hypothetical protein
MTYEYAVVACNVWGCSAMSSSDTGFVNGHLPTPTGVVASHGTFDDRVRVSWNPVAGASGYLVGRMPVDGGLPSTVWVTGTVLDDVHALPEGSVWEYWVSACFDPSSCSGNSASAYGWMRAAMFADGFESGSTSGWSQTRY